MELTDPKTIFMAVLPAWACVCAAAAFLLFRLRPDMLPKWERIPRAVIPGAILGFADLVWCVPNVKPILPAGMHSMLLPAAIALGILGCVFLDYLLSRAAGGFLILLAHYMLMESYAAGLPAGSAFAAFCLAVGTAGIFISGKPHLLRDFIRLVCRSRKWRWMAALFFAVFAALSATAWALELSGRA